MPEKSRARRRAERGRLRRRPETSRAEVKVEAKVLAATSYEKGFMKDALKYLTIANESDPLDFEVMLKLGWAHNILKNDNEAVRWFDLARRAPDAKIAEEAGKAYRNLASGHSLLRTTFWALPMLSTRWQDVFAYSQVKTEISLAKLPTVSCSWTAGWWSRRARRTKSCRTLPRNAPARS